MQGIKRYNLFIIYEQVGKIQIVSGAYSRVYFTNKWQIACFYTCCRLTDSPILQVFKKILFFTHMSKLSISVTTGMPSSQYEYMYGNCDEVKGLFLCTYYTKYSTQQAINDISPRKVSAVLLVFEKNVILPNRKTFSFR